VVGLDESDAVQQHAGLAHVVGEGSGADGLRKAVEVTVALVHKVAAAAATRLDAPDARVEVCYRAQPRVDPVDRGRDVTISRLRKVVERRRCAAQALRHVTGGAQGVVADGETLRGGRQRREGIEEAIEAAAEVVGGDVADGLLHAQHQALVRRGPPALREARLDLAL
jgi:hypothetical protein